MREVGLLTEILHQQPLQLLHGYSYPPPSLLIDLPCCVLVCSCPDYSQTAAQIYKNVRKIYKMLDFYKCNAQLNTMNIEYHKH